MGATGSRRGAVLCAAVAIAAACSNSDAPRRPAEPAPRRIDPAPAQVVRAGRCGECHAEIHDEWAASTHARAATTPTYLAMRRGAGSAGCERCHAPWPELASEGITCDVCHRIDDAQPDRAGGRIALGVTSDRRRGPLCDARPTYFHGNECSPLHERSELCGACHLWTTSRNGIELPVVTEFDEWQRGPYADSGVACQDCHMPAERREAATGAGMRNEVRQHRWLGPLDDLRQRALAINTTVSAAGARSRLTVDLVNHGAGHSVPSGLSGRQIVLRVIAVDRRGVERERHDRVYSRVLVDGAGAEVPFYLAERVGSDNRIAPEERRRESFELTGVAGGRVTIQLLWRALPPGIAAMLGGAEPQTIMLHERAMEIR